MQRHLQKLLISCAILLMVMVISRPEAVSAVTSPVVTVLSPINEGMGSPLKVAADSAGNFYVTDPRGGGILKYNAYGKLVQTIATPRPAKGIAVQDNGNLLVGQQTSVIILDPSGVQVGALGQGDGQFVVADDITMDASGFIYVVDSLGNCVQIFNANGVFSSRIGSYGTAAGQFSMPTAIAYEKVSNQIAVADSQNSRIQFFGVDGVWKRTIGKLGTSNTAGSTTIVFVRPEGIVFEYTNDASPALKRMYVSDSYESVILALDPAGSGTFLRYIGTYGGHNGQLMTPSDLIFDQTNSRLGVVNGNVSLTLFGIDGGSNPLAATTPPSVSIDSVPSQTSQGTITLTGAVKVDAAVTVSSVMVANAATGASEAAILNGSAWSYTAILAPGANELTVTAKDTAGNSGTQTAAISYYLPAPAIAITPLSAYTNTAAQTVSGTVDAGSSVSVSLNGAPAQAAAVTGTAWSYPILLEQGVNTIEVAAVQSNSLTGSATATTVLDTTLPALTVSALPDNSYTNNPTQNVSGTISDANLATVTVNDQAIAVVNGTFSTSLTLGLGANTIAVKAGDLAGNVTADTRTINFDNTAPAIDVISPADVSYTASEVAKISGTTSKTSVVTVAGISAQMNGTEWTATVNLVAGLNTIDITATDLFGNVANTKRTITFDNVNPDVAITSPAQDITTNQAAIAISGTAGDAGQVSSVTGTFNGATIPVALNDGAYDFKVTFPADGLYPVSVTATDAAGNTRTATRNITFDTTPPALVITADSTARPKYLQGTVEPGVTMAVIDKNGPLNAPVTVTGGTWTANLTSVFNQYDSKTLAVVATDAAGNSTVVGASKFLGRNATTKP